jgi:hypothetical protein
MLSGKRACLQASQLVCPDACLLADMLACMLVFMLAGWPAASRAVEKPGLCAAESNAVLDDAVRTRLEAAVGVNRG